jgi:hypothetical protein
MISLRTNEGLDHGNENTLVWGEEQQEAKGKGKNINRLKNQSRDKLYQRVDFLLDLETSDDSSSRSCSPSDASDCMDEECMYMYSHQQHISADYSKACSELQSIMFPIQTQREAEIEVRDDDDDNDNDDNNDDSEAVKKHYQEIGRERGREEEEEEDFDAYFATPHLNLSPPKRLGAKNPLVLDYRFHEKSLQLQHQHQHQRHFVSVFDHDHVHREQRVFFPSPVLASERSPTTAPALNI